MFDCFFTLLVAVVLVTAVGGATYCPNGAMDEDHVNSIITFINNKRAAVARGEVENGPKNTTCKYLPPTNDMQNLSWSCSIEEETIAAMSPCGPTISKSVPEQHCDLFEKGIVNKTADVVIADWLDYVAFYELDDSGDEVTCTHKPEYRVDNIIVAAATEIGCTLCEYDDYSGTKLAMYCLMGQVCLEYGSAIYEKSADAINTCTTTAVTSTTTTTESTSTTTPPTTSASTTAITEAPTTLGETNTLCPNNYGMNDLLRNAFLNKHNTLRSTLALGAVENGNGTGVMLREAAKMPTLVYCCDLEQTAYEQAKKCKAMDSSSSEENLRENARNFTKDPCMDLEKAAKSAVQLWWSEIRALTASIDQIQNIYYTHLGINSFAKIASDLTTGVGCAVVRCTAGFVNVVCHYETTLGNAVKLYNSGPTCNKCPEGTQSCVNGLCPTTEGQCPDVSTSTPTTAGPPNEICPNNHGMNDPLRTAFLDKHNALRSALALGTVSNGQTGVLCRRASKMPTLTYNCELEKTAYERANLCEQMTSTASDGVSENSLNFTTRLDRTLEDAAESAAQLWWSELSMLEEGLEQIQNLYYTHLGINSFAKMASDLTTQVGCGVVHCGQLINVVCHYNTTLANAMKLYTMGPSCRKCPEGVDNCYIGMCPAE